MPLTGDRYPFTNENIAQAPARHGVYQLEEGNDITYIGRAAGDGVTIRSRLQSHKNGNEGRCTQVARHCRWEVTETPRSREVALLEEYKRTHFGRLPRCNERVG